jgi:hypothetical protein
MKDALVRSIMTTFNVRAFLVHSRTEHRRRALFYAISATAVIGVLCAAWEISENSCERRVPGVGPSSVLDRKLDIEVGTIDPDGHLSLRPALDPASVDVRC